LAKVKKGYKRLNVDIPKKVHMQMRIEALKLGLKVPEMVVMKLTARTSRKRKDVVKREVVESKIS